MFAFKLSARITAATLGLAAAFGCVACDILVGDVVVTETQETDGGAPLAPPGAEKVCEVGATKCEGRALQQCADAGTGWATLEICETVELCESSDLSTVASCLRPQCAAEQMSCDGNMLRLCNAMRTGWELFDTCESSAHCDAGNRQCLPSPCEPGDRRCNVGNLERCNDDRTAWEPLDACDTNQLCEATLAPGSVDEVLSAGQQPVPASNAEGPIECLAPVCLPREVRCDLNRLIACNAGQTGLGLAEECATARLCEASISYTGLGGLPRCVRPACAEGEHRCTAAGVLEVCNADRDGYDPIEACIGSPFCNAVAADNGMPGCEDAPCDPGEMQCNGPQIQRCRSDQAGFEAVGDPCETRGLCNDKNPLSAVCVAPTCQRGPLSSTEFRCDGAALQRCNDQHTSYDIINTCTTPGLCNAALGIVGCQAPACAPNETRCNGNFVQRCNDQRTGFVDIEQCAPGTCDGQLGRCADPCTVGTARCTAQGNLEECRDLLVGREITARCGSQELCDAQTRQCRQPPAGCIADGVRRCRQQGPNTVLEECTDGRSRFAALDTCGPGEVCDPNDVTCDDCAQGSQPTCEGNELVTCSANGQDEFRTNCQNGCAANPTGPDRCRNCTPGSERCEGRQLVVCRQINGEEVLDRQDCDTAALCQQTIANCTGEGCACETSVCNAGDRRCNGGQPELCNEGRTGFIPSGPSCGGADDCNPSSGICFACNVGDVACRNGSLVGCSFDRSGFTQSLGIQRCVSDSVGERSQSCIGSQLIDSRCTNGSPVCIEAFGCQECDPNSFASACTTTADGRAARTECFGGDVQEFACVESGACVNAICQGQGECNTRPSDTGVRCTRPDGGPGICNGTDNCVECVAGFDESRCDDGNECTADSCSFAGSCDHFLRDGQACSIGFCSGTTCLQCVNDGDCDDFNDCSVDICGPGNACQRFVNSGGCQVPGGGTGTCNGSLECVATQICNPGDTRCVGTVLELCNITEFLFLTDCAPVGVCTPGGCLGCVDDFDCPGQVCRNTQCVDPEPLPPGPPDDPIPFSAR